MWTIHDWLLLSLCTIITQCSGLPRGEVRGQMGPGVRQGGAELMFSAPLKAFWGGRAQLLQPSECLRGNGKHWGGNTYRLGAIPLEECPRAPTHPPECHWPNGVRFAGYVQNPWWHRLTIHCINQGWAVESNEEEPEHSFACRNYPGGSLLPLMKWIRCAKVEKISALEGICQAG